MAGGHSLFGRFFAPGSDVRITGRPRSGNGASSMHLFWDVPPEPLRSVAVTLTVLEPPATPDLYFWALQASFLDGDHRTGTGHLGLQHHPGYPNSAAANWGGYDETGAELGGELRLPSSTNSPNTGDFDWRAGTSHRLRIEPGASGVWVGSITDLATNTETVVRDLWGGGSALGSPMVWSEVFAPCDAPSTSVRWTDPVVQTQSGYLHQVESARVNYQTVRDGGCSNTNSLESGAGVEQRTSTDRVVAGDAVVRF